MLREMEVGEVVLASDIILSWDLDEDEIPDTIPREQFDELVTKLKARIAKRPRTEEAEGEGEEGPSA